MPTILVLDDKLIMEALQVSDHRTGEAVVTEALKEYIQHRKQLEAVNLFNTIECDSDCDERKQRRNR